jgi:hypothetical protein
MDTVNVIPDKKQASILLGGIARQLLEIYGYKNYDYGNFVVMDTKNGIHWTYTLGKLTQHWGKMTEQMHLEIGAINLFCVDAENPIFPLDQVLFTAGLMGKKSEWANG